MGVRGRAVGEAIPLPETIAEITAELRLVHRQTAVGARVRFAMSAAVPAPDVRHLIRGAGFEGIRSVAGYTTASRQRTLPDWLRPRMRLLICGLNPSLYSADSGVPFGRPGNRFWPAARRAGLVSVEREPDMALERGIGFTDLVKRASRASSELSADEYRDGIARLEQVARFFTPGAICFVGLEGVRKALDRQARSGWLDRRIGSRPAYVMPSTSGRNANSSLDELAAHLARAAAAARRG